MSEMDERVVFEGSGKRGAQLYSDGNGYFYRVKERRSMTSWKLVCHNGLCRGSATLFNPNSVDDDRTIVHKHPHACEANKRLMEVLELKKRIMQRCREEETSLKQIYNEETSKCDEEVSSCLTWDGIESAMFKTRQKGGYPQIPLTVDDYITGLQDESARFNEVYEQSFLNGVVEEGEDIGIIFLVKPMSTPLTESDELYMDSSFRCVPKKPKFDRLLTIMAVNKGYAFPVVFCLLTKTSRALYEKIFAHLKEQLPDLAPQNIYTGYESDLKAALLRSFPSTKVVGTFFHYGQSICLKMQKLGLLALFRSNSDFNKAVHMLIALALLPPDKINEGLSAVEGFFDDAKSTQQVMCRDYVNTQQLFRYVKEHWIGRVGSQVFSVYGQRERTADCEDRLNRRLLWPLGRKSNPNIWIFQKNLVNMARQCVSDFMQLNYDEIVRGYRRTKWLLMEGKVKSASTKLNSDRISVRQFLLDISFKCSMLIPPMADSDAEEGGGDDDVHDDEFNDDDHVYFNMTLASQSQDHLLMAEEEEIETETEQLSIAETPRGQKKSSIKNDDYLSMSSPRGQKRPLTNDDDHFSMSSPHGQKRPLTKNEDGAKKTRLVAPDRNDACDNFGRNVASKLRAMNKIQRLAAEKIINETLFYGELEKLSLQFATNFGATIEDFNTVIEQEVESDFISKLI